MSTRWNVFVRDSDVLKYVANVVEKQNAVAGQQLRRNHAAKIESDLTHEQWHKRFLARHRRAIGFLAPVIFIQLLYWSAFIGRGRWFIYQEKYAMSITMVFGALIAGRWRHYNCSFVPISSL